MPRRFAAVVLAGLLLAASQARAAAPAPVVVELFTSSGCSSCPPADALLGRLAQEPGVLALSFHVNYWNTARWADPFASAATTARQRAYGAALGQRSIYTPEAVVDGRVHAVGSDEPAVRALIAEARDRRVAGPALAVAGTGGAARATVAAGAPGTAPATLYLLRFDRAHTTAVSAGENGGRTLSNTHVVREILPLATWTGAPLDVALPPHAADGRGAALLLQSGEAGPVLAAALVQPAR